MKLKFIINLSLLYILTTGIHAQFQSDLYYIPEDSTFFPGSFSAGINASGFFNNKEFFGTWVKGYTLTGNYFQPYLRYDISRELSLKAGTHVLWYHGQDNMKQVLPVFSIHYKIMPGLSIQMGSYNMGSGLSLPEPLYMFEYQFADLTGAGLKINKAGETWESVTWLNWLTFIEPGDTFREEFIFGHSGMIHLWSDNENNLSVPIYLLASHKGGQINDNNEPVETRMDIGTGIKYCRIIDRQIFKRFSLTTDYYMEKGIETDKDGNAVYGFGELSGDLFSLGLGYFNEKNWKSILGEPLYFSSPPAYPHERSAHSLLLVKAGIGKKITPGSSFALRFEGYFDPGISKFQYTYGIHLMVNEFHSFRQRR